MKNQTEKFLEFNGTSIYFRAIDGQWWIAIKPICDVLNVEYTRQFKNAKEDQILGQLLAEQPMVAADGRLRKMVCLPEKYIYGWLFSINSDSTELMQFKRQCYDVLFEHFHGSILNRYDLLRSKVQLQAAISKLELEMLEDNRYTQLADLKRKAKATDNKLRGLDNEFVRSQHDMFDQPENN